VAEQPPLLLSNHRFETSPSLSFRYRSNLGSAMLMPSRRKVINLSPRQSATSTHNSLEIRFTRASIPFCFADAPFYPHPFVPPFACAHIRTTQISLFNFQRLLHFWNKIPNFRINIP